MSVDTVVALLSRIPIFARLTPAQATEIARSTERIKFRSRDCITEAGVSGDGAYLLVSGAAEDMAEPGQPLPLGTLIGELAMLIDHDYGTTVVARERVHCLKISRSAMHGQMLADPSLAEHLSRHIRERLQRVANGLMRIDHLLAKSEAVSTRRSAFVTARPDAVSLDSILRAQ